MDPNWTATLKMLEGQLSSAEKTLAELLREKQSLQKSVPCASNQELTAAAQKHYEYILPLVKEIHTLELQIKEQTRLYEEKKWKVEAVKLGQDLLTASLQVDQCVLKRWSEELSSLSGVSNRNYRAKLREESLEERLGFTVLEQGVHVSLEICTEMACQSVHFLNPSTFKFGFTSDTFIPDLEETVKSCLVKGLPIAGVKDLVTKFILEEMHPYVIIVPSKKKGKGKKTMKAQSKDIVDSENVN